MSCLRW